MLRMGQPDAFVFCAKVSLTLMISAHLIMGAMLCFLCHHMRGSCHAGHDSSEGLGMVVWRERLLGATRA